MADVVLIGGGMAEREKKPKMRIAYGMVVVEKSTYYSDTPRDDVFETKMKWMGCRWLSRGRDCSTGARSNTLTFLRILTSISYPKIRESCASGNE